MARRAAAGQFCSGPAVFTWSLGDKDGKSWTVANPDAVKGHEGHEVTLKAHLNADKNEVHIVSVKMGKDQMKD